jgi:hypothetical protein
MQKYALLGNPGHNRVFFEASKKLSVAEFCILSQKMSVKCFDVGEEYIAGVFYITFFSEARLSEGENKAFTAVRYRFELAKTKEEFKNKGQKSL